MAKLKKGDFVKLNYTGFLQDEFCIDTTVQETAKKLKIFSDKYKYGPVTVCIGQGHILKGIDDKLEGMEDKASTKLVLEPKDAFGEKTNNLANVPLNQFKANKVNPQLGDQVMYNNKMATVKFVSNRVVILDFNHPYAGEKVTYEIETLGTVENKKEQLEALITNELQFDPKKYSVDEKDGKLTFTIKGEELPKEFQDEFNAHLKKVIGVEVAFNFEK